MPDRGVGARDAIASRKTSQPENIFKSCVRLMSVAKYCAGLCYIKMNEYFAGLCCIKMNEGAIF